MQTYNKRVPFSSGACIPLANKCNSKIDCSEDESDESSCSYLEVILQLLLRTLLLVLFLLLLLFMCLILFLPLLLLLLLLLPHPMLLLLFLPLHLFSQVPPNYAGQLSPRSTGSEAVPVFINISILAFPR